MDHPLCLQRSVSLRVAWKRRARSAQTAGQNLAAKFEPKQYNTGFQSSVRPGSQRGKTHLPRHAQIARVSLGRSGTPTQYPRYRCVLMASAITLLAMGRVIGPASPNQQNEDCRLSTADCRLSTADCRLKTTSRFPPARPYSRRSRPSSDSRPW
jgi:hypothetical protein